MKIVLYTLNYSPELTGVGKYSGELGDWLVDNGHELRVICAPPYYPEWKLGDTYRAFSYRVEQQNHSVITRCPLYIPEYPNAIKRLFHLLSFALSSFPIVMKASAWKPDIVIVVEPTFFCAPSALLLCKLSGAKGILHIQDFELDAMLGLGMARQGGLRAIICQAVESFFMKRFDAISSISNSMVLKAKEKSSYLKPVIFFPNWTDVEFIKPDVNASELRQRWGISVDTKVILYSGNLGKKQGLEMLIQAAFLLKEESDVLFLIMGDGVERKWLSDEAKKLNLNNICFDGLQPYEDLPALMAIADIHVVMQKRGVADGVMPSKLATILSAGGHAIITAEPSTELGKLCNKYPGIAELVEPENVDVFVKALCKMLAEIRNGRPRVNVVARQYAIEQLCKNKVLQSFEKHVLELVNA